MCLDSNKLNLSELSKMFLFKFRFKEWLEGQLNKKLKPTECVR